MPRKKDSEITISRVIAMCSIVFSHLCILYKWVTIRAIIAGVPLFILISGYLYGSRTISSVGDFVRARWRKIIVPSWVYAAICMIYSLLFLEEKPTVLDGAMYLFNLQGMNRLYVDWFYGGFEYCGILWFITVIFLCYLLIPAFSKVLVMDRRVKTGLFLACIVVTVVTSFFKIRLHYFWVFFTGYILSRKRVQFTLKNTALTGLICFALWAVRFLLKRNLDGTVFYDELIGNYSLDMLALFVFACIKTLGIYFPKLIQIIVNNRIVNWVDINSFYIYLTHYLFYAGIFKVSFYTKNLLMQTIIILIGTIIATIFFRRICRKIDNRIAQFASE